MNSNALRLALALAFLVFGAYARAADFSVSKYLTQFSPNAGGGWDRVAAAAGDVASGSTRSVAVTTAAGDMLVTDSVVLAGRAGALGVSAGTGVTALNAARAIVAASMLPEAVAIGSAAYIVWSAYKVFSEDGQMKEDPGTAKTSQVCWLWNYTNQSGGHTGTFNGCEASGAAAEAAYIAKFDADNTYSTANADFTQTTTPGACVLSGNGNTNTCSFSVFRRSVSKPGGGVSSNTFGGQMAADKSTGLLCPASIDASNPALSIPSGSKPYPDGTCPTARYNHAPIPADVAAQRLVDHPAYSTDQQRVDAFKRAIDVGVVPVGSPAAVTGPASQTGQPTTTTTTTPTGTTTQTTTPQYNYAYSPTTITVTNTSTTVTTNPDGSTSTSTTNTPAAEATDPCIKNPKRAGCAEMGEPPDPEQIPKENRDVHFSPEGGFGSDNGSCPALVHTQKLGDVDVFGLFCTYMSGIRFAVVGVAWIIGAMIFIGRVDT